MSREPAEHAAGDGAVAAASVPGASASGAGHAASARSTTQAAPASRPVEAPDGRRSLEEFPAETRYLNRELSWLQFNSRVMEEALDPGNPLLERVKFLSIYASNLDEFFMIRVSGLRDQLVAGVLEAPPDGMTPQEQLVAIREALREELPRVQNCWEDLQVELAREEIEVVELDDLDGEERAAMRTLFERDIFPILTPLAFDPGHPFPHISNLSLNLAVVVREPGHGERFARLKVPQAIDRLVRVPGGDIPSGGLRAGRRRYRFVWLEQLVSANLDLLFPGLEVLAAHAFRVTRDADLEIEEDEASDLLTAMAEVVGRRHFGSVTRLELDARMPREMRQILERNLGTADYQVYAHRGPLGLASLMELTSLDVKDLQDPPFMPDARRDLIDEEPIWSHLRRRDYLLYHPYDSFLPVIEFLRAAAEDPQVVAIKQTLYRTGPDSPVVAALMEARENGKQVSVLVELKARFDEQNNIAWAQSLEKAGVHVVYGVLGLKTHAKMCLVVRREESGVRSYVHLATGNYNPITARIYTDAGLMTSDPVIARDVSNLFNALTGYSRQRDYEKLLVAPGRMRELMIERIDREIAHCGRGGQGYLAFKMNSLVDRECIDALYRASRAGVRVDLLIRGICCLRPAVPGLSENVRVISLVGRFLEHSRVYCFANGGEHEVLMGSADLMPRNLDGRVETLFPVEDARLRRGLWAVMQRELADQANRRELRSDGSYSRKALDLPHDAPDVQREFQGAETPWR